MIVKLLMYDVCVFFETLRACVADGEQFAYINIIMCIREGERVPTVIKRCVSVKFSSSNEPERGGRVEHGGEHMPIIESITTELLI